MADKLYSELNKGKWDNIYLYTVADFVDHKGSSYVCIVNNSGQEPPNESYWALIALKGADGREIEIHEGATHIQWRYVGDDDWIDLVSLDDITGPQGPQGPQGIPGADGIGTGDVKGPDSSVSNQIAVFDGVTGKLIKDGGKTIAQVEAVSIPATYLDTDATLADNSDEKIPSQKATKAYVDGKVTVTADSTTTFTNKRINPRIVTAASYTTDTGTALDVSTCDEFDVTAQAGALKLNNPSGSPVNGQKLIVRIKDNGTARALTYDTQFRASSDLALPSTTVLGKVLYLGFIYDSTDSKWTLLASLNNI